MQMKTSYLHFTVSCFVPAGLNAISSTFLARYSTLYKEVKAGEKNQSLLHAKANKFSRNALIDSKPPGVTAHNTVFKSPFTIMSKFYQSGQRPTSNQTSSLSWNSRYSSLVHRFENSPLSDRDYNTCESRGRLDFQPCVSPRSSPHTTAGSLVFTFLFWTNHRQACLVLAGESLIGQCSHRVRFGRYPIDLKCSIWKVYILI